jgi:hypothetical protein
MDKHTTINDYADKDYLKLADSDWLCFVVSFVLCLFMMVLWWFYG